MGIAFRWWLHWVGQGAKLWLFSLPAMVLAAIPAVAASGLAEVYLIPAGGLAQIVGHAVEVVGALIALAVFTAVLSSQLQDHPLKPFDTGRKKRGKSRDDSKPQPE